MIKFIASDVDGTLLQGKQKDLDPEIFDLIRKLKGYGIRFAAASGRQYHSLKHLFGPISDEISYVAENGALCIHNEEILAQGNIERELALCIFDAIHQYGKCYCVVSCKSKMYTNTRDSEFLHILHDYLNYVVEYVEDFQEIKEDFLKIAIYQTAGTEEILHHFRALFEEDIKLVRSGNFWLDFIAPNANKATGLAALLNHFQIEAKDCVAFGDQYNDVEMLQFAGTSYAMSNSAPGISYYSTYVTDSVKEVLQDILAETEILHM